MCKENYQPVSLMSVDAKILLQNVFIKTGHTVFWPAFSSNSGWNIFMYQVNDEYSSIKFFLLLFPAENLLAPGSLEIVRTTGGKGWSHTPWLMLSRCYLDTWRQRPWTPWKERAVVGFWEAIFALQGEAQTFLAARWLPPVPSPVCLSDRVPHS